MNYTPEEIRQYTDAEIVDMVREHRDRLSDMKYHHPLSPVENPAQMRKTRKEIARMLTILGERQRQ